jgi:uncharacterized protein (UPF0128 family)
MWHVDLWGRREIDAGVLWTNLDERDSLEVLGVDERIILKRIWKKQDGMAWTGLIWLRTWTSGGSF